MTLYRTVVLTKEQVDSLEVAVRLWWTRNLMNRFRGLGEGARTIVDLTEVAVRGTNDCSLIMEPFVLWKYQMNVSGQDQIQVIVSETVFRALVLAVTTDYSEFYGNSSSDFVEEIKTSMPKLRDVLDGAALVDPDQLKKTPRQTAKTPSILN